MNAPINVFANYSQEIVLILSFVIGIGFGFFLERAGFGNANKLVKQFYFEDMAVFKVMFTAIITAMIGLFFLTAIGFLELDMVYMSPSHITPQIVGGLILGAGFIIGGYCPGTSLVSTATGRIDGMFFLGGVMFGILSFGGIYPVIEEFYNSAAMGAVTVWEYFNIPYGVLVFLVILAALGGFFGAEFVEKKFRNKKTRS